MTEVKKPIGDRIADAAMPILSKVANNKAIQAIQNGAMATMPLTLGTCVIAVLYNLPFEAVQNLWTSTGIGTHMNEVIAVTMSLTGVYMSMMIGYYNAHLRGKNGVTGAIITLGSFLALMPHEIAYTTEDGVSGVVSGLATSYLGSNGVFAGMILALCITGLYVWLDKKGLVVKLPDSVPPNVSASMAPTFSAMIIFTLILVIRVVFGMTSYGNYFDFINGVIGTPIMSLGSTPGAIITVSMLAAACWFFGIHPNTVIMIYYPVMMTLSTQNTEAFLAGEALPNLMFVGLFAYYALGGTGNTLGLALIMPFTAKSERYKALGKLAIGPGIFNINEPLVFGLPIMMNPIYFIPLVGSALANCLLGLLFFKLGVYNTLNPTVSMPWVTPAFITPFFTIGILGVLCACVAIAMDALIYFPFYKKADQMAYEEEQAASAAAAE